MEIVILQIVTAAQKVTCHGYNVFSFPYKSDGYFTVI